MYSMHLWEQRSNRDFSIARTFFIAVERFENSSERAVDISFRRAATQILKSWSNAPLALYRGVKQAVRATVAKECVLWGCPGLSFKAKLPFKGMRQLFAALLKEISTARYSNDYFLKATNCSLTSVLGAIISNSCIYLLP